MAAAAAVGGVLAIVAPTIAATVVSAPATASPPTLLARTAADTRAEPIAAAPDAGVVRLAALLPVVAPAPAPAGVDVSELIKAAGLADVARHAAEVKAAREAAAHCDADLDGLGRVKPWVRDAAQFLSCLGGQPDVGGVSSRGRVSDHPSGHAVDFMVRGSQGDTLAECALANQDELGITYVIWEQRVNYGDGWERMSDRGGDTANHVDHVHVSFERRAPSGGDPVVDRCGQLAV